MAKDNIREFGVFRGRKWLDCRNCRKSFWCYKSNDINKQFCSVRCKSVFSRVERICKNCAKSFTICRSTLEQSNTTGNYCSRPCYIAKMTTGITRNKHGFRTISEKMRKDNPRCALCGTKENIHNHHIEPYRYTQNNKMDNLIPLCNRHHKTVEHQTEELLKIDGQAQVFLFLYLIFMSHRAIL